MQNVVHFFLRSRCDWLVGDIRCFSNHWWHHDSGSVGGRVAAVTPSCFTYYKWIYANQYITWIDVIYVQYVWFTNIHISRHTRVLKSGSGHCVDHWRIAVDIRESNTVIATPWRHDECDVIIMLHISASMWGAIIFIVLTFLCQTYTYIEHKLGHHCACIYPSTECRWSSITRNTRAHAAKQVFLSFFGW